MNIYEKDNIVTGKVTGIESYGIFVSLDNEYDGLIHISEISSDFVRNVSDYAEVGETIQMKIIDVNKKKHHVKLSIKDIDYRFDKKGKIEETIHGFETLKNMLPIWIEEKSKEQSK
jgi:general stress protein 13